MEAMRQNVALVRATPLCGTAKRTCSWCVGCSPIAGAGLVCDSSCTAPRVCLSPSRCQSGSLELSCWQYCCQPVSKARSAACIPSMCSGYVPQSNQVDTSASVDVVNGCAAHCDSPVSIWTAPMSTSKLAQRVGSHWGTMRRQRDGRPATQRCRRCWSARNLHARRQHCTRTSRRLAPSCGAASATLSHLAGVHPDLAC